MNEAERDSSPMESTGVLAAENRQQVDPTRTQTAPAGTKTAVAMPDINISTIRDNISSGGLKYLYYTGEEALFAAKEESSSEESGFSSRQSTPSASQIETPCHSSPGDFFTPLEAKTPLDRLRRQRQLHSSALSSRPRIEKHGSNAESITGCWEGETEQQAHSTASAAGTPASHRRASSTATNTGTDLNKTQSHDVRPRNVEKNQRLALLPNPSTGETLDEISLDAEASVVGEGDGPNDRLAGAFVDRGQSPKKGSPPAEIPLSGDGVGGVGEVVGDAAEGRQSSHNVEDNPSRQPEEPSGDVACASEVVGRVTDCGYAERHGAETPIQSSPQAKSISSLGEKTPDTPSSGKSEASSVIPASSSASPTVRHGSRPYSRKRSSIGSWQWVLTDLEGESDSEVSYNNPLSHSRNGTPFGGSGPGTHAGGEAEDGVEMSQNNPLSRSRLASTLGSWPGVHADGEVEADVEVSHRNPLYRQGHHAREAERSPTGSNGGLSAVNGSGATPSESRGDGLFTPRSSSNDSSDSGGNADAAARSHSPVATHSLGSPSFFARMRVAVGSGFSSVFARRARVSANSSSPPAPAGMPSGFDVDGTGSTKVPRDGETLPDEKGPDHDKNGLKKDDFLLEETILGKTPLASPTSSQATTAESSPTATRARPEVEVDLEEGKTEEVIGEAGTRVGVSTAAEAVSTTEPTTARAMVLPCAPTDEEKVLYVRTGRAGVVTFSLITFIVLSCGMWLFTLVTPAFYWFGILATFFMIYTFAHYFAVAIWGKDFQPDEHNDIVKRSEERGYRPAVDVFLPVCSEPLSILSNTWTHVSALDYPNLNVFVLDDGKSEEVRALATTFGFRYILRDDAPVLKKAGNLRNAFAVTSGEVIAIFDADFCPRPDFLKESVPYLGEDPSVGIVQTPQFFRYRKEQTWIEQGAGVTQEFFYRMVQVNQDKFNAAVCVGSCGLYRRQALEPLGGMAAIEHSEDMYTGYKMTEHGFKIKYIPLVLSMGICPDEPHSFFMQQYRWCKGSATLVAEKEFWESGISKLHKLCFLNGMMYYLATSLLIFVAPLPILLLVWVEADDLLWYHSAFVLPSIAFATIVMPLWSKQRYGFSCYRVKILQCYAHIYAIKDAILGRSAPWVPSGRGGSRSSSAYLSSVKLLIAWNVVSSGLIVGGSAWRMTDFPWYHFLPAMAFAIGSFVLNLSTLIY